MKIIRLDHTGHTEVACETVDETIAELEKLMNEHPGRLAAVVESEAGKPGTVLKNPQDLREYGDESQIYLIPRMQGG